MAKTQRKKRIRFQPQAWILWVVVVVSALALPTAAAEKMTDQNISDAVENEFLFDRAVPSNNIDVRSNEGIITLSGKTNNVLAKERAARIAETVKGVRSIVNRIEVKPSKRRSDTAVQQDVTMALLTDPATDSYEVVVTVKDGEATLTGSVESWTEKELCGTVAKGVRGVTAVDNAIRVDHKTDRTDSEIKLEIEKALRWDVLVDHALIDVAVSDGEVTLTGVVGSAAEKTRARRQAWVAGVKSVDDSHLKVERWARDKDLRKNKYVVKSPSQIRDALSTALLYDPRVMSFNVTPSIAGSTVTLRGTVDNLKAKRAAEQVAKNTVGVTYVMNRIKVRPTDGLNDAEIAGDIREALLRDPYVDRFQIDASVIDGTAYLFGTVDSYFEKWQADEVASKVNGVTSVRNNLIVEYKGPIAYDPYVDPYDPYDYDWYDYRPFYTFKTDLEIKENIESELWWSPYVGSDEVTVTVDNGTATLTGTVDSWTEYWAAADNAYEGGAVWVDNELKVK